MAKRKKRAQELGSRNHVARAMAAVHRAKTVPDKRGELREKQALRESRHRPHSSNIVLLTRPDGHWQGFYHGGRMMLIGFLGKLGDRIRP